MTDASTTDATAVSGELVELPEASVIPSNAEVAAAADRAVGRTTQQVAVPVALVVIGAWAARLWGVDLNPLPGQDEMPAEVVGAWIGVITWVMARRMNPKPKG